MIGVAVAGIIASVFTYEKHPPAMSTVSQTKEAAGIDGQSDTELGLVSGC